MASMSDTLNQNDTAYAMSREEWEYRRAKEMREEMARQSGVRPTTPPWQTTDPKTPYIGALNPSNGPVQQCKVINKVLLLCN